MTAACWGCSEPYRCGNECPDVNHGPVWVEVLDEPVKPPYGSPQRVDQCTHKYAQQVGDDKWLCDDCGGAS